MRLAGWRLRCTHCVGNLTRTSVTLSCRYWHQSSKSRVTLTSDLILLHVFPGLATFFRSSYPVCFPSWNVWNLRKLWKHLIEQEVCLQVFRFFKRCSVELKSLAGSLPGYTPLRLNGNAGVRATFNRMWDPEGLACPPPSALKRWSGQSWHRDLLLCWHECTWPPT